MSKYKLFCASNVSGQEKLYLNGQKQIGNHRGVVDPLLSLQKIRGTMDRRPTIGVVHGSGQILDRICEDIVQFSQRLLSAPGKQR
jgi:hypothetical protein